MRSNELETVREPPFNSGQVIPASFTCLVLANRMANAAKSRNRLIRFEEAAFSGLWIQYHRYLLKHLAIVNKLMQSEKTLDKSKAIFSLYALLCLDCSAGGTMWRAHLNGSMAYVQHLGGVTALQALPRGTARFCLILRCVYLKIWDQEADQTHNPVVLYSSTQQAQQITKFLAIAATPMMKYGVYFSVKKLMMIHHAQ